MTSSAIFSPCRKYRYKLERVWRPDLAPLMFIMLNPSVADENRSDPTITRCLTRALNSSHGGLEVYNAFAFVSTQPENLYQADDPIGAENDQHLAAIPMDREIIVAWGGEINKIPNYPHRDEDVLRLLNRPVMALKVSKYTGHPHHPLYLDYKLQPFQFRKEM